MSSSLNPEAVRDYYGTTLQGSQDLKTNACCCDNDQLTPSVKAALAMVEDEVISRFYGCGSPFPPALEGCTVLDLGCGTGRDVYAAAKLVGPKGRVIGVDMTTEQLEVARRNVEPQMKRFGYEASNVEFLEGQMEDLAALGLTDNSVDVVISNCVINLSADKRAVFSEIFRVLKPGGELLFSDVFSGRRIPEELHKDPVLHGECLSGALYKEDFRRLMEEIGCPDVRVVDSRVLDIGSAEVEALIGMIDFYSETVRAFAIESLEDRCEDYGQIATYKGSIPDHPHSFDLDDHHNFQTGKPMLVCGNTASMLSETRFSKHFTVQGDRSTHFGLFDCAPAELSNPSSEPAASSGCC